MAVDGGSSEPLSRAQFPANREIYREFCEFGLRILETVQSILMNLGVFRPLHPISTVITEQGIITPVTRNHISLLPTL